MTVAALAEINSCIQEAQSGADGQVMCKRTAQAIVHIDSNGEKDKFNYRTLDELLEEPLSDLVDRDIYAISSCLLDLKQYGPAEIVAGLIRKEALREQALKEIPEYRVVHVRPMEALVGSFW